MKILLLGTDVPFYEEALKYLNVSYDLDKYENLEQYDGLLIPGGIDVDPSCYHKENLECHKTDKEFDLRQLEVIDFFVKNEKPILGICRGHQLLNVYFNGDLIQDLKTKRIHYQQKEYVDQIHPIKAFDWLEEIYTRDITVNSSHHQAIGKLGDGLMVCGLDDEGVVEAIRHKTLPIIGVQFHPERMCLSFDSENYEDGLKIFEYFLDMINR